MHLNPEAEEKRSLRPQKDIEAQKQALKDRHSSCNEIRTICLQGQEKEKR